MTLPRYFIPEGVERPAHLQPGMPGFRPLPGVAPMPGLCLGGDYSADANWLLTKAGWSVCLDGVRPSYLRRTFLYEHETVARGYPDGSADVWLVPRLLTVQGDGLPGFAILERRDYDWRPPPSIAGICERLRAAVTDANLNGEDEVVLVADILSLHYWISIHELEVSGWLTPQLIADILKAATGIMAAERQVSRG